jgi:hypothetical protein
MSLSDKFHLSEYSMDVTPADWTFYINALIYFWQSLWLTYGVTMVCRKTENGYFYIEFPIIPPILYVVFSFSLACNISWLLIWDRKYMEVALVFINLMTCTVYICLIVSLRRLNEYGPYMARQNLHRDIWLMRVVVCNGLAMLASWGTVAAMFNFAVVLTYGTGARKDVAATVSLAIFTLEIASWWIFDNLVFERLLRYLYTPYIVLIYSIIGILHKNWNSANVSANNILVAILLVITSVLFIIKIILSIYRHRKYPMFVVPESKLKRPQIAFEIRHLLNHEPPQERAS